MTSVARPAASMPPLSVVIPFYDEEANVVPLLEAMHASLSTYPQWELILVDDGSRDGTLRALAAGRAEFGAHVRVVALRRNFGQSAAMQAGIDAARGEVVVTLDGDLQNDPADIPAMVRQLQDEDLDLLVGWRRERRDTRWLRRFPSWVANQLIGRVTGVRLHDYGCSLKVYRAEVLHHVRLYGEMHRFIPAWMAKYTAPERIQERVVRHHPRRHGQSKYGLSRTLRVLLDLLAMLFFLRYSARPGHFFGGLGVVLGGIGGALLGYLLVLKIGGADIGDRPMLLTGILLVLMGVQLLTTGVLGELLARTYYESNRAEGRAYTLIHAPERDAPGPWRLSQGVSSDDEVNQA